MSASTKRFLIRKGRFLLLVAVLICFGLLIARDLTPAQRENAEDRLLEEASDRACLARSFALDNLIRREGIEENDVTTAIYSFSMPNRDVYYVGFAYRKDGQEKLYGYCVRVDSLHNCAVEFSNEALGQQLIPSEAEEAADSAV